MQAAAGWILLRLLAAIKCCVAQATVTFFFLRMLARSYNLVANISTTCPEIRCNAESVTLREN